MEREVTLLEYEKLCASSSVAGTKSISPEAFNALEDFLAKVNARDLSFGCDMQDVFRIASHRGAKVLQALNYVGVVSAGNTSIEILPKIGRYEDTETVRLIFLKMLLELKKAPYKHLGTASLRTTRRAFLEIFISMFLDEVREVIKRGICSDYREWEGNERFIRGRINFNEHIRCNHSDQSRAYVEYDIYHVDRPENRLIRSTLIKLRDRSRSSDNKRRIKIALDHLAEVGESTNPRLDFASCKNDRNLAHYSTVLSWCQIFLADESPTTFPGIVAADALLFPMERIFEDYVAARLKKACAPRDITLRAQESKLSLFDNPKLYRLRPDIVARRNGRTVILDTKWKLPANGKPTQSDMYQMFAYAARYNTGNVVLVYPASGNNRVGDGPTYSTTTTGLAISVHTFFYKLPSESIDCASDNEGAEELARYMEELL